MIFITGISRKTPSLLVGNDNFILIYFKKIVVGNKITMNATFKIKHICRLNNFQKSVRTLKKPRDKQKINAHLL